MKRNKNDEFRFFSHVLSDKNGCWVWQAGKCKGYGRISINNQTLWAHRFSWEIRFGKIPHGMCVLHKCDNPPCCNPEHLFLGTKSENSKDRDRKGRQARQKGESHGQSKLTKRKVLLIRKSGLSGLNLARKFSVSEGHISAIRSGKKWS